MTLQYGAQLTLGQIAPDFEAETTDGPIRFGDWAKDSWVVFFSHPRDFTPVCTTELGEAARLKPEWDKRGVKVIGLSVDPLDKHDAWAEDIHQTQGTALNFPMIADPSKHVSQLYGMIHPEADPSITVRTVYVLDPARKVCLTLTYPPSTGRNFHEVLRVIEALAQGGMTMVLVTHEMEFAARVADTIIYMHEGKVWETGPGDMLKHPQTAELRDFLSHGL
eukprot:gene47724-58465_t